MPAFVPTEDQRRQVETLAGYGIDHYAICRLIINPRTGKSITPVTLRKAFRDELDGGMAKANSQVAQSLWRQAIGAPAQFDSQGNKVRDEMKPVIAATIFWAKARMNWYDTPHIKIQHSGSVASYDLSKLSDEQIKQLATILTPAAIAPSDK